MMKALVATTKKYADSNGMDFLGVFNLGGKDLSVAAPNFCRPTFDVDSPNNAAYVLIKVLAFSCNYRDKGLLLNNIQLLESGACKFLPFGSEFCGEIVAVGKEVIGLKPGDRVMGNNAYPDSGAAGVLPGVATNFASLGYLRLHNAKVVLVPEWLSDESAAAFSIGSQTATGMIRASGILTTGACL
ncbi:alcohol dehydrogenase catalytic domain-containing protein [Arcanobacterium hippocoleae]|uniref:alcohol dehydrogenase catalytic domain-containing protein n=1 Tax=Arcanobacterium hippocoleae TaxID=149017 RepID=UPI003341AC24